MTDLDESFFPLKTFPSVTLNFFLLSIFLILDFLPAVVTFFSFQTLIKYKVGPNLKCSNGASKKGNTIGIKFVCGLCEDLKFPLRENKSEV